MDENIHENSGVVGPLFPSSCRIIQKVNSCPFPSLASYLSLATIDPQHFTFLCLHKQFSNHSFPIDHLSLTYMFSIYKLFVTHMITSNLITRSQFSHGSPIFSIYPMAALEPCWPLIVATFFSKLKGHTFWCVLLLYVKLG